MSPPVRRAGRLVLHAAADQRLCPKLAVGGGADAAGRRGGPRRGDAGAAPGRPASPCRLPVHRRLPTATSAPTPRSVPRLRLLVRRSVGGHHPVQHHQTLAGTTTAACSRAARHPVGCPAMGAPDPRVVRQLRHDVDDVYELLDSANRTVTSVAATQRRHSTRFEEIQQSLDLQNGRLERIEDTQRHILDLLRGRVTDSGEP